MKKTISLLLAFIFVFALCSVTVFADASAESEPIVFEEPAAKQYAWLYYVIGAVSLAGVITIAVVISKKFK